MKKIENKIIKIEIEWEEYNITDIKLVINADWEIINTVEFNIYDEDIYNEGLIMECRLVFRWYIQDCADMKMISSENYKEYITIYNAWCYIVSQIVSKHLWYYDQYKEDIEMFNIVKKDID